MRLRKKEDKMLEIWKCIGVAILVPIVVGCLLSTGLFFKTAWDSFKKKPTTKIVGDVICSSIDLGSDIEITGDLKFEKPKRDSVRSE